MIPSQLSPIADHLWQSTLFALFAGLLTLAFRNNRAAIRYGLWLAASIKFFLPFSILVDTGSLYQWRTATASSSVSLPSVIERVSQPFLASTPITSLAAPPTIAPSLLSNILLILWAIGFVALLCSWYLRLRTIRIAMRAASSLTLPISMPALTSREFSEPGVFGIFRPVLLLPTGIVNRLTPAQLEAVVAHELCHVRRRDNLTSVIHMAVEAVFWFHPLVWWLGARLMEERERACDEEVLRNGHDPQSYAEGILKICELYLGSSLQCVAGVTGSNLKRRIETIMSKPIACQLTFAKKLALTVAVAASFAVPIAVGVINAPPLRAQTTTRTVEPTVPSSPRQPVLPNAVVTPKAEPRFLAQQGAPQAAVPSTPAAPVQSSAVILMMDTSSSMEGKKMDWARTAALRLVQTLGPDDTLGILAFDNQFTWAVAPQKVADRATINQLIATIQADGGTQIAPALTEAYARVLTISASHKHIVLLTDGVSEEGNSIALARAATNSNVTISTVGLGRDVNRRYLETLAQLAGGTSYFATQPQDLEQILVRDMLEHAGSTRLAQNIGIPLRIPK